MNLPAFLKKNNLESIPKPLSILTRLQTILKKSIIMPVKIGENQAPKVVPKVLYDINIRLNMFIFINPLNL